MANENMILMEEAIENSFEGFDKLEEKFQKQLEKEISDLDLLEKEKERIKDPENLKNIILDEVWMQFANQIGLDITNETLIQKYDREHPEESEYKNIDKDILEAPEYKSRKKDMSEKQKKGILRDEYTGKNLAEGANLDHTVSRKELYENKRRKQANLSVEKLANKPENLNPTNQNLNKSKGEKSVNDFTKTRDKNEERWLKENEKKKREIDNSNLSEIEKKIQKEKEDKYLQNKLDADDNLMIAKDKEARKAINREIFKGVTKEIGKKAGKDALKQMTVTALFSLLKEIMNGLVRFFKSKVKSFELFLKEMKQALEKFFSKITNIFKVGISSIQGTIVSEIFGPIVSTFKKLASLIKQGIVSIKEAILYLKDKENKNKPFNVKILQIGKIITAGLVVGGAIFLGEVIEKLLLNIPGMQIEIQALGSLANIIGLFLASVVSGIIGAIVINKIDKAISKKQREEITEKQINKRNKILSLQEEIINLKKEKLETQKEKKGMEIKRRHEEADEYIKQILNKFSEEKNLIKEDKFNEISYSDNQDDFNEIDKMLEDFKF